MWRYSHVIRKEIKPNFLIMNANQETIQPAELKSLLPSGCCLIDVREPVEHAEEHIVGAKLIPLGQLEQRSNEIDRKAPVVVMCRSGKRGAEAMKKLHALGITNVRNLEGGILAWKGDGLPVGKSRGNSMPLMQQSSLPLASACSPARSSPSPFIRTGFSSALSSAQALPWPAPPAGAVSPS